jgi:hypothetical protein
MWQPFFLNQVFQTLLSCIGVDLKIELNLAPWGRLALVDSNAEFFVFFLCLRWVDSAPGACLRRVEKPLYGALAPLRVLEEVANVSL